MLIHVVINKALLVRDLWAGEAAKEMRRREP